MAGSPVPIAQYDTWDKIPPPAPANGAPPTAPPRNVRWVAMSADGGVVTTVVNRYRNGGRNGSLVALSNAGGKLALMWERPLARNPNSTSIDPGASCVVASDGYPFGTPGAFYGFDASGTPRWVYETTNMNWPIVISSDGKWIAGGGDDGMVYTFPGL
jgi:outer membrane protein assembly factor BamB